MCVLVPRNIQGTQKELSQFIYYRGEERIPPSFSLGEEMEIKWKPCSLVPRNIWGTQTRMMLTNIFKRSGESALSFCLGKEMEINETLVKCTSLCPGIFKVPKTRMMLTYIYFRGADTVPGSLIPGEEKEIEASGSVWLSRPRPHKNGSLWNPMRRNNCFWPSAGEAVVAGGGVGFVSVSVYCYCRLCLVLRVLPLPLLLLLMLLCFHFSRRCYGEWALCLILVLLFSLLVVTVFILATFPVYVIQLFSSYFPVTCWFARLWVGAVAVLFDLAWQGQWVRRTSLCTYFFLLVLGLLAES